MGRYISSIISVVLALFLANSCNVIIDKELETISIFSPAPFSQIKAIGLNEEEQAFSKSLGRFSFTAAGKLYNQHPSQIHSDIFSPLSFAYVLGIIANGTAGEVSEEITSALVQSVDLHDINLFFKTLSEQMPAVDLGSAFKLSNIYILNDQFEICKPFKDTIAHYYYAPVVSMPFSDPYRVLNAVNSWCNQNTGGLIPTLTDKLEPGTASVILSALYFKSLWDEPYDSKLTCEGLFYVNGAVQTIKYLSSAGYCPYADNGSIKVVSKSLGHDKYRFYLISPKEGSIQGCLDYLAGNWPDVKSTMRSCPIRLKFPEIEINKSTDLIATIEQSGIHKLFDTPDFSPMLKDCSGLSISRILQNNTFLVNEMGVQGGSATLVDFVATDSGNVTEWIDMTLDHPFVYVVEEKSSGVLLFIGVMAGD